MLQMVACTIATEMKNRVLSVPGFGDPFPFVLLWRRRGWIDCNHLLVHVFPQLLFLLSFGQLLLQVGPDPNLAVHDGGLGKRTEAIL